ncbi:ArnT family glycosyltransferase [Halobacteroides halobius]|uniref:ArnT family glycosyltransferase n=1 Tax=Halobacteroides halobius TaxID=42422 RepID=UPI0005A156A8|nr:glycosyltransferase family 39 protein [Halobacteroides halobius]
MFFLSPYPHGWDAVDFILGIDYYDLSLMQPHFPGYPIYIWLGKIINQWVGDEAYTLALLSAVFGGLSVLPFYMLVKKLTNQTIALLAGVYLMFTPLHLILSAKIMSDMPGTFFILVFLYLTYLSWQDGEKKKKYLVSSAIVLGIALGVRVSYFPYLIIFLISLGLWYQDTKQVSTLLVAIISFTATNLVWLGWQIIRAGGLNFFQIAINFTAGHFNDWGGTVVTDNTLVTRLIRLIYHNILVAGLGFYQVGDSLVKVLLASFILLGLFGFISAYKNLFSRDKLFIASWFIPYSIWVFFGQNIAKPRHVITLIPLFVISIFIGWQSLLNKLKKLIYLSGIIIIILIITSLPLVTIYKSNLPPVIKLSHYLNNNFSTRKTIIYTFEEERVINYYYPNFIIKQVRNKKDFYHSLLSLVNQPENILMTNSVYNSLVKQDDKLQELLVPIQKWGGKRLLYPVYNQIILYQAKERLYDYIRY